MARRDSRRNRKPIVRLDLSELEINAVLLEDLRLYVGSPKVYVPKIWDICVNVLRQENRIILTERDNEDTLDAVYDELSHTFSESKCKKIIREHGLSVKISGYKENVTNFYFDVFEIIYPQVAGTVSRLIKNHRNPTLTNFLAEVIEVEYDTFNDGFGDVEQEVSVIVEVVEENMLTSNTLRGDGYGF